jgi:hypothetical protein
MILFVHEETDGLPQKHGGAGANGMLRIQPRQIFAHEMALVEELAIHGCQLLQPHQ